VLVDLCERVFRIGRAQTRRFAAHVNAAVRREGHVLASSRFIEPFVDYYVKACDGPVAFGYASALMTLSGVSLGRRWISRGKHGIKPNLYMMLVGESSVARKSTSVVMSKDCLTEIDEHRVGPTDYTMEGLVRWMAHKNPETNKSRNKVVLYAEEFGSDLARMEAYAKTVMGDLCRLYDGETFVKVRAQGPEVTIDKPRVSMFAACAYDMLSRHLSFKDWSNGFLMRYLFVAPSQMRAKTAVQPKHPEYEWKQAMLGLKVLRDDLAQHTSAVDLTASGEDLFLQFSTFIDQQVASLSYIQQVYAQRFLTSVLKLSLLYQTDISPFMPIDYAAVNDAIEFAYKECWPSFMTTVEKTTSSDFQSLHEQTGRLLRQQPLPKRVLSQRFMGNRTLDDVVNNLQRMGHVVVKRHMNGAGHLEDVLYWVH